MRFARFTKFFVFLATIGMVFSGLTLFAQETTAGLQGTVKDASGAVVANARVVVRGTTLAGDKALDTEPTGYYRFANLPPGVYSIQVSSKGFKTVKREGLTLEVGHLPTVDITLEVGGSAEVVEVTSAAPLIDSTTNTNQTNLTSAEVQNAPHGYSFQSVIQFAPMARNEPLAGGTAGAGTAGAGGMIPGSSGNGQNVGYSVGGGADSENQYLVEGQDTENISGGISAANVPFQFIQEMQVKSSGIEAEHGGALGGVVNVVMKKGGNAYHGSFFGTWEGSPVDGSWLRNYAMFPTPPVAGLRYDPLAPPGEPDAQTYIPKRDHFSIVQTGFSVGGPIMKDRLWFFLGFAPQYNSSRRTVNFGPSLCATVAGLVCPDQSLGNQDFTRDLQQYFTTARLDFTLSQKVRVFGSWLYQYARESGDSLPNPDPIASQSGFLNSSILSPLSLYSHGLGFSAPNATYNVGADITLTPKIVSTTRFGYFFQNYHDFGWPTQGLDLVWGTNGVGALANCTPQPSCTPSASLPTALQQGGGFQTAPYNPNFTEVNASRHYQFNEDFAFFKSGWWGTHNIKAGYQFNRLWNIINQHGNIPQATLFPGAGAAGVKYAAGTAYGNGNCGPLVAEWGVCAGQYGYMQMQGDFATVLKDTSGNYAPAIDNNHALFVQDAWTIGHGLTLNLGVRVEKETLPRPAGVGIANIRTIDFSWSDKVEPRLGAAWGSANGKFKIFGSYGVTNDVMKLLLAQTSFGAQGWDECAYPLGPDGTSTGFSLSDINIVYNAAGRACPTGPVNTGAVFSGSGATPASLTDAKTGVGLIENLNFRPEEPIVPGLKPYRQHEFVAGVDYQIGKNWAFEARYDRRRLDHAIEDSSLSAPCCIEYYAIVNPGQGVDSNINQYASFLRSLGAGYGPGVPAFDPTNGFGTCSSCPPQPKAVRNYDGVEFRLTKTMTHNWSGMFSYTWSRLWGNYPGLTTTDQSDGGITGRNSPDTSRSFDEPFYYFAASGKSSNGPLPTDRPSTLKGNLYYTLPWKGMNTTLGLFQVAYQGSPVTAFSDVGLANGPSPFEGTYLFGRGNWANVTADPTTGLVTGIGAPYARRTPWFTQTDVNLGHEIKVNHNNEAQRLRFDATFANLLNQHAVLGYWQGFNSNHSLSFLAPGGQNLFGGAAFYQAAETGFNVQSTAIASGVVLNSLYNQPNLWQTSRNMRFGATFTW